MLRSPLEALKRHRVATAGVIAVLAATLWLGAAVVIAGYQVDTGATAWFERFAPVVYLEPTAGDAVSESLGRELEDWSPVERVDQEHRGADLLEQRFQVFLKALAATRLTAGLAAALGLAGALGGALA